MKGALLLLAVLLVAPAAARPVWTPAEATAWSAKQPWLIGANYIPSTAVNQLEMWQAETFDPATIDRELGWAEGLGMNSMRVFLHDLPWQQDAPGFKHRIDVFLSIAARHHIRILFVLFDSCWDPDPVAGPQRPPIPGVHNPGWVQSPGAAALADPAQRPRLRAYVEGVVAAFARDPRVLGWDIWNEPDSPSSHYPTTPNKLALVTALIGPAFAWARAQDPAQPLTSGVFQPAAAPDAMARLQLAESDVVSFHDYRWPEDFAASVRRLVMTGRPVWATEYMARGAGSTFDTILPIARNGNVGVFNWGFVDGRTQTRLPWDSWTRSYLTEEPTVWFHDVLHHDGTPYRAAEAALIRRLASAANGSEPVDFSDVPKARDR